MALAALPDLSARLRSCQRGLRARLERRETLAELVRATHAPLNPQTVAEFLVRWAGEWLPISNWAIVCSEPGRELALVAEHGLAPSSMPAAQAIAAWIVAADSDLVTPDLSREARLGQPLPVAALAFRLKARDRTIGALVGLDTQPATAELKFATGVLDAWHALLEPAAVALENGLLLQRAEALSVTDDLTRLYNSRYLNQSLRRETKRASRSNKPLSLLFIDLDGFKSINDTYGHLHGSRALVEAAAVIRGSARETDVVARFGGDEFAVVLPETTTEGAWAVAERIRDRVADHRFLASDLLDVRLTASVGVATMPDAAGSAEELVQAADRAMYRVKMTGKNGIQLANG
jgi:diguanylate cyclase (GGDEF)-like protein